MVGELRWYCQRTCGEPGTGKSVGIGKQKGSCWGGIWTGTGALGILPVHGLGKLHELSRDHGAALQWANCRDCFSCSAITYIAELW